MEIDNISDEKETYIEETDREQDTESEPLYMREIQSRITHIAANFKEVKPHNDSTGTNADVLAAVLAKFQGNAVKPKLQCTTFSGKENDKPECKSFLIQVTNCVDASGNLPGSVKVTDILAKLPHRLRIENNFTSVNH